MRVKQLELNIGTDKLSGRLVEPATGVPAVLFVHGWAGSQERDTRRARALAQLGFVCFTFDLRGHGESTNDLRTISREENLQDLCVAYDFLVSQPQVDRTSVAVIGSSYGGYLAALLAGYRPVRWLGLRVPALYRDEDWTVPKFELDKADLAAYRRSLVSADGNVALDQCRSFEGDVLIVESEHDEIVPHPAVASYLSSFISARSVTYRVITGADHALSDKKSKQAYDELLSHWLREMIFGAR